MSKVINLNKMRKDKARAKKEQTASENRVKFGRTKEERALDAMKDKKLQRHVDNHRLSGDDNSDQI